jgi:hypothetical protein
MSDPSRESARYTLEEWQAEARRRFGEDPRNWKFICPSCKHVASALDWKNLGAPEGEIAFSCIGRRLANAKHMGDPPGPCNYAGGGLFRLNPVTVVDPEGREHGLFAFAEADIDLAPLAAVEL